MKFKVTYTDKLTSKAHEFTLDAVSLDYAKWHVEGYFETFLIDADNVTITEVK